MLILGIETSCDESAAAVLSGKGEKVQILSNVISSQINIHNQYGGVVPEVAAREHVINLLPTIAQALRQAKVEVSQIKAIAITAGPGLITSLIAGTETVRSLALAWNKKIIPVNHLSGHVYANFINPSEKIKFPLIALIVSGGHSSLVYMKKHDHYQIIGDTRDDAAGEAYDKAAKMLGLGYPGGPIIANLADKFANNKQISTLNFPRPMIDSPNLDFSFSGLKTALLYQLKQDKNWSTRINEYCYAYQQAIIEVLTAKSLKALKKHRVNYFLLAGGVSANLALRANIKQEINKQSLKVKFFAPELTYTTDNAAMIASAAYFKYFTHKNKAFVDWSKLKAKAESSL